MKEKEIMQSLRICATHIEKGCGLCPQMKYVRCTERMADKAITMIERLTAENTALREKQRWIPVTERMPEERVLVNVVWVNRAPEPYYEKIKYVPFSGTACFYRGNWYWDSPVVLDLLAEYGKDNFDLVDHAVDITHWMPMPGAPEEGGKA